MRDRKKQYDQMFIPSSGIVHKCSSPIWSKISIENADSIVANTGYP